MTEQITLKEALKLVSFHQESDGTWRVNDIEGDVKGNVLGGVEGSVGGYVKGNVCGSVKGTVCGNVCGDVVGNVIGTVCGDVYGAVRGDVCGTISGRKWQFVETPKDKLRRLIEEDATNSRYSKH